ncbi:MAG: Asp-tRNA(Asn)/Glu-tRNA(Gln) amidotransferase subunit GatC [bacterium]|nr:Asp-tRNA(Asn)/Glu-tRNA(Gln) amidotransferase subunit GatC [bacterium]
MEEKLSREEVLHVANLARIEIDEEEIAMYQVKLKQLLNEIEKVNEVKSYDEEMLICPTDNKCELREDIAGEMLAPKEALKNAPRSSGNYFQVPVVIGESGEAGA